MGGLLSGLGFFLASFPGFFALGLLALGFLFLPLLLQFGLLAPLLFLDNFFLAPPALLFEALLFFPFTALPLFLFATLSPSPG